MKPYVLTYNSLKKLESIGLKFGELNTKDVADLTALFWACSVEDISLDEMFARVIAGNVGYTLVELMNDLAERGKVPEKK